MTAAIALGLLGGWVVSELARDMWRARRRPRLEHGPCADCTVIRAAAANGIALGRRKHTCPEGNGS